jgi:hypothetical protein
MMITKFGRASSADASKGMTANRAKQNLRICQGLLFERRKQAVQRINAGDYIEKLPAACRLIEAIEKSSTLQRFA